MTRVLIGILVLSLLSFGMFPPANAAMITGSLFALWLVLCFVVFIKNDEFAAKVEATFEKAD